MQIEIKAKRVPVSQRLRNYFESQMQIALGRFDESIMKVSLRLSQAQNEIVNDCKRFTLILHYSPL